MINILHNWQPPSIIFSFGPISLYWYGLIIALAILLGYSLILRLANYFNLKKRNLNDLALWLILAGIIGARVYEIFLEWSYYWQNPLQIFKIWEGGLAIHGAILAGLIVLYFFAKKRNINFWQLSGALAPGLALGQAIGRFGNWFNQELFGLPTKLPWGIPISLENRPWAYIDYQYFHPTFLYESLGNLIIFLLLIFLIFQLKNKISKKSLGKLTLAIYLFLYSGLRFLIEFIRLDPSPELIGLRWPQIFSLIIALFAIFLIIQTVYKQVKLTKAVK